MVQRLLIVMYVGRWSCMRGDFNCVLIRKLNLNIGSRLYPFKLQYIIISSFMLQTVCYQINSA